MANLENQIFQVLGDQAEYDKYREYIPEEVLSPVGRRLLGYVDTYWNEYPGSGPVDWNDFSSWLKTYAAPRDTHLEAMCQVCDTTASVSFTDTGRDVLNRAVERDVAEQIEGHLAKDDEVDPVFIRDLIDGLDAFKGSDLSGDKLEVATDIEDVLKNSHVGDEGLPFSLDVLKKSVGPLRPGDTVFIPARPEVGKCLGKGTPVLLYDGTIKRVEDVDSSDVLMGPDSNPKIPFGFVSGREPLYRITYPWGESYVVNESHILSLKRSKTEGYHENGDILNVSLAEYLDWPDGRKHRYKGWKTDVDFPYYDVESNGSLSPYILGAWLGDGHSDGPRFTTENEEVVEAFEEEGAKYGLRLSFISNANTGHATTYSIVDTPGANNLFLDSLREMDVYRNKHIPRQYLYNQREVRLKVLAGLLDTDGSVAKNGFEIVQKNKALAEDILYLSRSVGYHAILSEKYVKYCDTTYYRVHIYGDFTDLNPHIRIERKRIQPHPNPKRKGLHFSIDIEYIGVGEYYGFAVGGDGLFVLGDFTVTHNTTFLVHQTGHMIRSTADTNAVIFSNEEDGNRVMIRLYQSVLNWTTKEILSDPTTAKAEYERAMGCLGRVRVIHAAKLHRKDCERVIDKYEPNLIVFNMLSKIGGFGSSRSQNDVDVYSAQGVWMRELANGYNCAAMTAWQAGGSAHGKPWVEQDDMYGSKTGIVAEADVILGIGKLIDPAEPENHRYLHLSKNKLAGDSHTDERLRHGYFDDVYIDAERGRFHE